MRGTLGIVALVVLAGCTVEERKFPNAPHLVE